MSLWLNSKENPQQSTEDNKSIDSSHFDFWHEEVLGEQK